MIRWGNYAWKKANQAQNAKPSVEKLTKKPLWVRYAEVLRLREAILATESAKRSRDGYPVSR